MIYFINPKYIGLYLNQALRYINDCIFRPLENCFQIQIDPVIILLDHKNIGMFQRRPLLSCCFVLRGTPPPKRKSYPVIHASMRPREPDIDFNKIDLQFPVTYTPKQFFGKYTWSPKPEIEPNLPFKVLNYCFANYLSRHLAQSYLINLLTFSLPCACLLHYNRLIEPLTPPISQCIRTLKVAARK